MSSSPPTFIFRGATVHTCRDDDGTDGVIDAGEVAVEGGKIVHVGPAERVSRPGVQTVDLAGRHLCPGFIDAHVHLGVMPEGFANESKDINEMTDPVTPELQAIDGLWPGDVGFARARAAGVTTVCVLPGASNVIGGTGVVVKTVGCNVEKMALRSPACLKVAFGHAVKHSHGIKQGRRPLTRMAVAALFRQAFERARTYGQQSAGVVNRGRDIESNRGLDVLVRALEGELPVRAHCRRSDDLLTALRLASEFGLRMVLEHAYEARFVLDEIAQAGVSVVLGPAFRCCGTSEELHFDFETTQLLDDAGVCVAHMSDHPIVPVSYLSLQAGLCVRAGMAPDRALRTITANPARILELDNRIGAIATGYDADLVILDGPPLEIASRVLATYIGGVCVFAHGDPLPVPGGAFR